MRRDVLALVHDGTVRLLDGRLPEWTDGDGEATLDALMARSGGSHYLSPTLQLGSETFLHVLGAWDPPPGEWAGLDDVPGTPRETHALRRAVRQWSGLEPAPARAAWFRAGWFEDVEAWVDEVLQRVDRGRSGRVSVVRQWSLSAVLRVATEGREEELFFKATAAHFHAEPAVTRVLTDIAPQWLPLVVGADDERAWMLMESLRGLDGQRAEEPGAALARAMAEVQLLSLDRLADLRSAGCPDRTLEPTLSAFDDLLHHSVMFGDLTDAELVAARAAAPLAKDLVHRFWDCGLPDTVSHGDLHPGNVAYEADELRIFDWTDAAVSHPFLDAAHFARSALGRQVPTAAPGLAMDSEIVAAFVEEWRSARPTADVDTAMRLAPFVDQLYQTVSYEGIYRAVEPDSRWELAGVVEQFLRGLPATARRCSAIAAVSRSMTRTRRAPSRPWR